MSFHSMAGVVRLSTGCLNRYNYYNHHSNQPAPLNQTHVDGYNPNHTYTPTPAQFNELSDPATVQFDELSDPATKLSDLATNESPPTSSSCLSSEPDVAQNPDYYEGVLGFVNQMLMEEDNLQNKPCMLLESLALQAAEKSFHDALVDRNPPLSDTHLGPLGLSGTLNAVEQWLMDSPADSSSSSSTSQVSPLPEEDKGLKAHSFLSNYYAKRGDGEDYSVNTSRGKRNTYREDGDDGGEEARRTKQLAGYEESPDESELMDRVLLCPDINPHLLRQPGGANRNGSRGNWRHSRTVDPTMVDLMSLLTQCGQALAIGDSNSSHDLLKKIKQYSSPQGDSTERLAHHFSKAIEARLAGTGNDIYKTFATKRISAVQTIKSFHMQMTGSPFHKMSSIIASNTIKVMAKGKGKLHIIDFGVLYGFQWPSFIQKLSLRPGGPPKLRITGIDFPQPGFRPAERVEDTGRRLENYCKRFNVPFEFNAIAKKWETIKIEELKIETDEIVIVNCLYRLQNVPDETVVENSPRDAVLKLIKKANPDLFINGVTNGTYNAPFFLTRFREALFHFSALFDMLDATALREDNYRLLFEQEFYGKDVMNIIACEGTSRIERPETYKQWQARTKRAGFRQIPLSRDVVKEVRAKVKLNYHKDFLVDEDSNWLLQGWKGRVLYALSIWKPVQ